MAVRQHAEIALGVKTDEHYFIYTVGKDGWFSNPDNCAFDAMGRLWISTDGNSDDFNGRSDGIWAVDTEGPARGTSKHFYRCPAGAEMCGPCFTPDLQTLFVAVQHPAEDGKGVEGLGQGFDVR